VIESRHKVIACFVKDKILLDTVQKELSQIADIEAILTRLSLGRA
jgi:DNA mismatch repair ATPase MutS